ncbi:tryptophan--tRNA ligase [Luteimonas sp. SX5]|uniref:Tryptophan--tRNA ligase n=1 Tax=Luteimonas galliterrae TaxID=2940486 RepID=A0ABT0MIK6_9GAMM|nr:tryptophan--tRNA ligase [Luteimonas galliterrae]MCL1634695.1 tryptophan--tRNA ligase [Luteimonas galliterrae]
MNDSKPSSPGRKTRVLTGITTSGTPHLGNYVGAIRPAIAASHQSDVESFYFLADLHSLIKLQPPERVQRSTLEIAAAWLAAGLDPSKVWFYRQSDIPEITELTWLLTCVAGKGILNRAHAYKAAVDKNRGEGEDDDAAINAGLFMYPVLMAADILLFNAERVPVGRDQIQHIEMARDFGQRFNHIYGDHFALPEAAIEEHVATLPGLDGRKMSKSYDNVIPLSSSREQLKKLIFSIVTDSRAPGEAKEADGSNVFQLYQAFATADETAAMRQAFADGIGWGDAKQKLFERIDAEIAPLRERYQALVANPQRIEEQLRDGAQRVRAAYATPLLGRLREAVGLRDLSSVPQSTGKAQTKSAVTPQFKQYRENDGRFYFKLVQGERVLLQSIGFDSPKEAGARIGHLKREGAAVLHHVAGEGVHLGKELIGKLAEDAAFEEIIGAVAALVEADA